MQIEAFLAEIKKLCSISEEANDAENAWEPIVSK